MSVIQPQQLYEFSGKVASGDRLDAQFAEHASKIVQLSRDIGDIRRDDGQLRNHSVTTDTLSPDLMGKIVEDFRKNVQDYAERAVLALQAALAEAHSAKEAALEARNAAARATAAASDVNAHS